MKRAIVTVMIVCIILTLVACSGDSANSSIPTCRTNDNVTKVAKKVVEILDKYLSLEIDREAANESFSELKARMGKIEGMDLSEYDYDDSNHIVLFEIDMCFPIYEWDTDRDIENSRDIIAFHVGVELLKESHSIEPFAPDDSDEEREREVMEKAGIVGMPASFCSVEAGDNRAIILVTFDSMYGISAEEFCDYSYEIFSNAASYYGNAVTLSAQLNEYERSVVYICLQGHEMSDIVASVHAPDNEEYPKEAKNREELEEMVQEVWKDR